MKAALFFIMMFFRPLFKTGSKFIGGILMFGAIFGFFTTGMEKGIPLGATLVMLLSAFVIFLIDWFYDSLLLKLNPENNILILNR